jgi:hypothetical protein
MNKKNQKINKNYKIITQINQSTCPYNNISIMNQKEIIVYLTRLVPTSSPLVCTNARLIQSPLGGVEEREQLTYAVVFLARGRWWTRGERRPN